jgi:hypothetical protein
MEAPLIGLVDKFEPSWAVALGSALHGRRNAQNEQSTICALSVKASDLPHRCLNRGFLHLMRSE